MRKDNYLRLFHNHQYYGQKLLLHFIATGTLVLFILLGMTCAIGPKIRYGETSRIYFNRNGGIGTVPSVITVEKDGNMDIPGVSGLTFGDAIFDGWYSYSESNNEITYYKAGETFTPPGGHITLYAKWNIDGDSLDSVNGLANKLVWLQNNAESNGNYNIVLNSNEKIGYQFLSYPGKKNVTITISGIGGNRSIGLLTSGNFNSTYDGTLFAVGSDVTLILDKNITLLGNSASDRYAVIEVAGKLIMNDGAIITGNNNVSNVDAAIQEEDTQTNERNVLGQIIFKDGTYIEAKVIEVTPSAIKYQYPDKYGDQIFLIHTSSIHSIKYENGTLEKIKFNNSIAEPVKIGINVNAGGAIPLKSLGPSTPSINIEFTNGNFNAEINIIYSLDFDSSGNWGLGGLAVFNYLWEIPIGAIFIGGGAGYIFNTNGENDIHNITFGANLNYRYPFSSSMYVRIGAFAGGKLKIDNEVGVNFFLKPDLGVGYNF